MITAMKAYSLWSSAQELLLDPAGQAETDLFQITNIDGLGPVTSEINTSPMSGMDGDSYVGSSVGSRNIVLTIRPNPDWSVWTYTKLRQLLYTYFMPKRRCRLVFETDEFLPVEIWGYVESNEPAIFSKEGEIQISIICPYPYFTSVAPITIDGTDADFPLTVDYEGTVETGINVQISWVSGGPSSLVTLTSGDSTAGNFNVFDSDIIDEASYFVMSSIPGQKFVRSVQITGGQIRNLLSKVVDGSPWPQLWPGANNFFVGADGGVQNWRLVYYNRYGGL